VILLVLGDWGGIGKLRMIAELSVIQGGGNFSQCGNTSGMLSHVEWALDQACAGDMLSRLPDIVPRSKIARRQPFLAITWHDITES
jgi:hypothetical protein